MCPYLENKEVGQKRESVFRQLPTGPSPYFGVRATQQWLTRHSHSTFHFGLSSDEIQKSLA